MKWDINEFYTKAIKLRERERYQQLLVVLKVLLKKSNKKPEIMEL